MQIPSHVTEHIETIAKHEQEFLAKRTLSERVADRVASFAGSMVFVLVHVLVFLFWVAVNTLPLGVRHFDPHPFPLLGTIVALEAILLASFILMRQALVAKRSDERDHLMLQLLLLTEKEVSAVVRMNQGIADYIGLKEVSRDREIEQLGRPTPIDAIAETIQEKLSADSGT